MKKISFLLALLLPQLASAYDFMVDGLCYNRNSDGNSVTVVYDKSHSNLSGDLVIPETFTYNGENYTVTAIDGGYNGDIDNQYGIGAFSGCSGLTSVTIPRTITSIGDGAFSGCNTLTSVTWNAISCETKAFLSDWYWYDAVYIFNAPITYFVFGEEVRRIPASLCNGLIGLTSLTIPNSVRTIDTYAFCDCSGLTSLTIGRSVSSIGYKAFGYSLYDECNVLQSIVVEPGNTVFDSRDNCNAIITTATNTIYKGCKNTIIPNSVTAIGNGAFLRCSELTEVIIPNSVTSIGSNAFGICRNLTSVTIPTSVTSINSQAFTSCNVKNLSITGIGASSVGSVNGLTTGVTTLTIGSEVTSLKKMKVSPTTINCYAETPPTCTSTTFSNYDGALHVPTTAAVAYMTASYWKNFLNVYPDLSESITLDKSSANMIQWDELQLNATLTPTDLPDEIVWTTSNPDVAMVTQQGKVTAVSAGECYITASLAANSAISASCKISASYPEITLTLDTTSVELTVGDIITLQASISPDNTGLTPTWTTSNQDVATVSSKGVVTAVGAGSCNIKAIVLNKQAVCRVTVTLPPPPVVTISLDVEAITIEPNQIYTLTPSFDPVETDIVVSTSDPTVLFARVVSQDSVQKVQILGLKNGRSTITIASADGTAIPATCEVTVGEPITMLGDANGDGIVDVADINVIVNIILGKNAKGNVGNADVNNDGKVDVTDLNAVVNIILGNYAPPTETFTANGVSFKMVEVEGGTFTMGTTIEQDSDAYSKEGPAHLVTLSSYSIGQTEVTQALWQAVMGNNPSYFSIDNGYDENLQLPVENVNWEDCQTFITNLSQLTGKNFRLPTEAEWEYAAHGGNRSHGNKYSGSANPDNVAWYANNSNSATHPVGTKVPNELGIYDMSGNVWEWCQDWYDGYSNDAQTNPTGPLDGTNRVYRGGGWNSNARLCRMTYRTSYAPSRKGKALGLRLAL